MKKNDLLNILKIFGVLIVLFSPPLFVNNDRIFSVINSIAITTIVVQGLNILTGWCGQISLGQSAFVAIGAYTSGFVVGKLGLPFWVGMVSGALSAGFIGLIFGLPSLRLRGFYLVLATVAAHFIIVEFLPYQLADITGGAYGLQVPPPKFGGIVLDSERSKYFLIVGVSAFITLLTKNLLRTKTGRAFIAVKNNELATSAMGINVYSYKLLAFFIGCLYAGIAGSLFAHHVGFVVTEFFTIGAAIWYLGMIIVGGEGSIVGAIMGTIFLSLLSELAMDIAPIIETYVPFLSRSALSGLNLVIPGVVIILFLIIEPRGLYHRWQILKMYFQLWPYSRS